MGSDECETDYAPNEIMIARTSISGLASASNLSTTTNAVTLDM